MNNKKEQKRRTLLINRDFQFKLILKFILINLLVLAVFSGLVYIFFDSEVTANLSSAHVTYKNVSHMLFPIVLTLSIINLLVTSIIIAVVVLYASHKIAGPLYRFNVVLEAIGNRNLKTVTKIRDKDQLKIVSASFTRMVETLSGDLARMKEAVGNMRGQLPAQPGESGKELLSAIEQLEAIIDSYKI
jgi:methyl-accepting chemotaxis protein